jgi:UDP-GlcNAc3NAcA epimerase
VNVMQDPALIFAEHASPPEGFEIGDGFVLATFHRAENSDARGTVRVASVCASGN